MHPAARLHMTAILLNARVSFAKRSQVIGNLRYYHSFGEDDFSCCENFVLLVALTSLASAQETRHFTFHYGFTVKNILAGDKVRIWFPAAHSDAFQEVKIVSATGDLPLKRTRESKFGNEIYYAETSKSKRVRNCTFDVIYDVVRHEHLTLGTYSPHLERCQTARQGKEGIFGVRTNWCRSLDCRLNLAVKVTKERPLRSTKRELSTIMFSPPCAMTNWHRMGTRRCALRLRCEKG